MASLVCLLIVVTMAFGPINDPTRERVPGIKVASFGREIRPVSGFSGFYSGFMVPGANGSNLGYLFPGLSSSSENGQAERHWDPQNKRGFQVQYRTEEPINGPWCQRNIRLRDSLRTKETA